MKKKKITYKQKLIFTLMGGLVFLMVVYNVSIRDTIELSSENNNIELQIANSHDAPEQIKALKQRIGMMEQLIGTKAEGNIDMHQLLLDMVTQYCQKNQLILKEFPLPFETEKNGYLTKTAKVVVEGDFIALLKLVYHIEKKYKVGKIASVGFKAEKELKTRKRKLQTTLYIQHIKSKENENS